MVVVVFVCFFFCHFKRNAFSREFLNECVIEIFESTGYLFV